MKKSVQNATYGEITYEESFWVGRKRIYFNGAELTKLDRKTFQTSDGKQVTLKGNYLTGVKLFVGGETIEVIPAIAWYEIAMSLLPFILIMVWGNVVALCRIIPVVGGALGGAISGIMTCANIFAIKNVQPLWMKAAITVAVTAITFGICAGVGYALLSVIS